MQISTFLVSLGTFWVVAPVSWHIAESKKIRYENLFTEENKNVDENHMKLSVARLFAWQEADGIRGLVPELKAIKNKIQVNSGGILELKNGQLHFERNKMDLDVFSKYTDELKNWCKYAMSYPVDKNEQLLANISYFCTRSRFIA